jgi:flagellar motor switch protein FliN
MAEEQAFIEGVIAEFASVLNATLGVSTTAAASATAGGAADWLVACTTTSATGTPLTIGFDGDQAAQLSARVLMSDETPPDGDIADTLKELVQQALGAFNLKPMASGAPLAAQAAERRTGGAAPPSNAQAQWFALPIDAAFTLRVICWAERRPANTKAKSGASANVPDNLDVILDIDLPVSVRFGHAEMTLDALTKLGPGSLIELARSPDDPVELLVNGKLVARGEVVVVSGNYGVRVSEVVSAADRIRTLE